MRFCDWSMAAPLCDWPIAAPLRNLSMAAPLCDWSMAAPLRDWSMAALHSDWSNTAWRWVLKPELLLIMTKKSLVSVEAEWCFVRERVFSVMRILKIPTIFVPWSVETWRYHEPRQLRQRKRKVNKQKEGKTEEKNEKEEKGRKIEMESRVQTLDAFFSSVSLSSLK